MRALFKHALRTLEANPELFTKAAYIERNKSHPNLGGLATYPRELNIKWLEKAKEFCSTENPLVKNLLILRHHFLAHSNYKVTFGNAELFQKEHALPFRDIRGLIHDGFDFVNSIASTFGASVFPESANTSYPVHDYNSFLMRCE